MAGQPSLRNNAQRGISLIEVLGALAIGSLLLIGLTATIESSLDDTKGQQAALYQSQIVSAAAQYIQNNYNALFLAASTSVPTTITLAQLTAVAPGGPYLSASIAPTNIYQQTPCVLVLKNATTNRLDALVVTIGGQAISDLDGASIAANSGAGGGFISGTTTPTAQGATWSLSDLNSYQSAPFGNCQASAGPGALTDGHLASELFNDSISTTGNDFLYRDQFTGQSALNTMNTALLMANSAIVSEGSSCGTSAGIAIDANRNLMTCATNGLWSQISSWKTPVTDFTDLASLANTQIGDVRMVTDISRAFTYNGSDWVPLAIDQKGNFAVPGSVEIGSSLTVDNGDINVTTGNINATTGSVNVTAGNVNVNAGNITATSGTITATAGNIVATAGDINAGHDFHAANNIFATGIVSSSSGMSSPGYGGMETVAPGQACNIPTGKIDPDTGLPIIIFPFGSIYQDANGVTMNCYSDNTFRYENGTYTP